MSHKVTVNPDGKVIEVNEQDSLFAQLKSNGYNIKSTCGGCASCGKCVIKIVAGDALNEPPFVERQLLGNVFHITHERLSCQTYVHGDVTIDISEHIEKPVEKKVITRVRKKADLPRIEQEKMEKRLQNPKPKKLGGNRRPKAFDINEESIEQSFQANQANQVYEE